MKIVDQVGAVRRTALCFHSPRHPKPRPADGAYLFSGHSIIWRGHLMRILLQWAAGALILGLVLPGGAGSPQSKPGAISGHVLACNDGVIPGARVQVAGTAPETPVKAVTDELGRFRLPGLRAGLYSLEVVAPGFQDWKRTGIEVAAGRELAFEIVLQLAEPGRDTARMEDLPTLWRSADAVLFFRIQDSLGVRLVRTEAHCVRVCTEHRVAVLEVFRRYRGEPREFTMNFLQRSAGTWRGEEGVTAGQEVPGKPGEEFVAFMTWSDAGQALMDTILVPVRDGQVRHPSIEELQKGMALEAFLKILRTMME
jgi:hypothetical protein